MIWTRWFVSKPLTMLKIIDTICRKTCVVIGPIAKSTKERGGEKRDSDGGKKKENTLSIL